MDWYRYSVTNTPLSSFIYNFDSAWSMVNWLTRKSSNKYKIKRKYTFFFSKYQIYVSWVENVEIFTRAVHSCHFWCFQHTRWNIFRIYLKKVNILYKLYIDTHCSYRMHYHGRELVRHVWISTVCWYSYQCVETFSLLYEDLLR